jgi:hypothetical protein
VPSFEAVRILRLLITSLVILAGLFGALLLMIIGLVSFLLSRLFGRAAPMPRFQASFRTARPGQPRTRPPAGDVIDVVATEVKDQRTIPPSGPA